MLKEETEYLISQIRAILLNGKLDQSRICETEELKELQSAIFYLGDCMEEFQAFLQKLCAGDLAVETPGKQNFLAGYAKELHSILKHLTWQASKVAEGDYQQKVTFLGDFSVSFNKMIQQLEEREIRLQKKTEALSMTTKLLQSIMDQQAERVLVLDLESDEFVFANKSARLYFYNPESKQTVCGEKCRFLARMLSHKGEADYEEEYSCDINQSVLQVKGVLLNWEERNAYAYFISDITQDWLEKNSLEQMAYMDPLTSFYNRRYCVEELKKLKEETRAYSLILLDMDRLKMVNDTFGHDTGDGYIKTVAEVLAQESRADDAICRIGGDEFVIIWRDCRQEVAERKMRRVVDHLGRQETYYPMSVSYGVVHIGKDEQVEPEAVLKWADAKMYEMKKKKHAGRN